VENMARNNFGGPGYRRKDSIKINAKWGTDIFR
jgi:hypothetical protein